MKTFRKSSLISSVALLLVAIVALSGATFAWFSTSDTAEATGLSAKAGSGSGLLISETKEGTYTNYLAYETDGNTGRTAKLAPASSAFDTATPVFYTATAAKPDNYAFDDQSVTQITAGLKGYVNLYPMYIKTADDTTQTVTVSVDDIIDGNNGKAYGRIAITNEAGDILFYYAADGQNDAPISKIVDNGEDAQTVTLDNDFYAKLADTENDGANSVLHKTDGTFDLANISKEPTLINIYVWNEGQDKDCDNNTPGLSVSAGISLSIKTAQG